MDCMHVHHAILVYEWLQGRRERYGWAKFLSRFQLSVERLDLAPIYKFGQEIPIHLPILCQSDQELSLVSFSV